MKCWGYGQYGQLGQGTQEDLGDEAFEMGENLSYIDLGSNRTVVQAAAGGLHTCALLDNHAIKCWGHGGYGQLGLGNTETIGDDANEMGDNLSTVDLGSGRTAQQVAAGAWHSCALLDDFSVKCWGSGLSGQLGQNDQLNIGDSANELGDALPAINLGSTALKVVAGVYGQLGDGTFLDLGDSPDEKLRSFSLRFFFSNLAFK
ncbi:unnamed protein product [Cladocopium goreaui]|uniref:E3 ISG15--protein ligase HERC5 (Cyclin-E-bindin g protein 1) (HECT domain and RCC1-like domain-containing protein 5) n=1 Tax=Cladocopium goreaui TaxID=2562237 RepID=A0A9P1FZW5_9DINO|nr:unnamed protein product [Cladocopium goreaui]